jgi:hypothetical protein
MMDDLLAHLFGEAVFGKMGQSRRAQLLFRVFFGLLGAGLGVAGAIHFGLKIDFTQNTPMRFSIIALFAFLASFSLFNVALGRKWRWPAMFFLVSLVSVFATRIFLGT